MSLMRGKGFQFRKSERIVSQKTIDELFSGDHSHSQVVYPVRAVFMSRPRQPGDEPVQLLLSVPKRRFRHAVDRNRVKRQLREAYRHHRQLLADAVADDQSVALAFIWLSSEHVATDNVDHRVSQLLSRIAQRLSL